MSPEHAAPVASVTKWHSTPGDILTAIQQAEAGVSALKGLGTVAGIQRAFTLDGRLVGDIGELIIARHYEIVENEKPKGHAHDLFAMVGDKKKGVQVKLRRAATTKIVFKYQPEVLIVLKFKKDWSEWQEVYHGSGSVITAGGVTINGDRRLLDKDDEPTNLGFTLAQLREHRSSDSSPELTPRSQGSD